MHACELVDLAALVAAYGPTLIHGEGMVSPRGIEQYWTASRCRLDRWARALRGLPNPAARLGPARHHEPWPVLRGVFEEVLTGEVLSRVFAAVAAAYDRQRGTDEAEPLASSVLAGHLDARNRVLALLVRSRAIDAQEAIGLNRLRRRAERWTDLLLGYLADHVAVGPFAVDAQRASDFADDLRDERGFPGGRRAWPLLRATLTAAFEERLAAVSPNADLNARIATGVLSCFRADLFDSTGVLRSLWLVRLTNGADDAQGMLDAILEPEAPAVPRQDPELADDLLGRLRRFGSC